MKNKNTHKSLLITSIITAILITSGVDVVYADGEFPGKNIFGETTGSNANTASGDNSAAFGWITTASGEFSTALGTQTVASGRASTASGWNAVASGDYSTAGGWGPVASGFATTAFGHAAVASGENSAAIGWYTTAQPQGSFAIGHYNEVSGDPLSWVSTDPLFMIGNGTEDTTRHNVVTVLKNGNVGISISSPTQPLQVAGIIESTSGGFKFPDGTIQTTSSIGSPSLWVPNGNDIYYNTGNVGIGTSSPSEALDITGNTHVTGNSIIDGNVGIGTTNPNSELQVSGYIQLDTSSGKPPSTDCDGTNEIGRMKVDSSNSRFYICADGLGQGINWKTGALR